MNGGMDFLNFLHHDLSLKILLSLDDPSDLVRLGTVSHYWRHFVITNRLCKHLCVRMFPQLSRVDHVRELTRIEKGLLEAEPSNSMEGEEGALEREHRVFAFLAHGCKSFSVGECLSEAIIASSTDNYPEESIQNTLEPRDRMGRRASYWSSKGQINPAVPETLTYKLVADLCVISEINIRPFQAYFQSGYPIYSAKSVRFHMGHMRSSLDNVVKDPCHDFGDDNIVWTYTSQEFPMVQENCLQHFKFPEPVICIGGFLQIELLGRVQKQEMDGLFYICVSHVQVVGRALAPAFGIVPLESSEKFVLNALHYSQSRLLATQQNQTAYDNSSQTASINTLQMRVRDLEQMVNLLRGNAVDYEFGWEIDEDEDDFDGIE